MLEELALQPVVKKTETYKVLILQPRREIRWICVNYSKHDSKIMFKGNV